MELHGKRKRNQEKPNRKKFRNAISHPNGIQKVPWPTLQEANAIFLDECGLGAWMGPITICAVYLKPEFNHFQGIHDSKKLKPHEREKVNEELRKNPHILFHVEHMSNTELDDLGGLALAWKTAMERAVYHLQEQLTAQNLKPNKMIVDGNRRFSTDEIPLQCIQKADSIYVGVAIASILAKVERDAFMVSQASNYPEFEEIMKNGKGYRHSKLHEELITRGIFTNLHRKTYNPLKSFLSS